MNPPLDYIISKSWKHKLHGDQIIVEICPFCKKNEYHFYMNAEHGAWDCKVCGEVGGMYKLKKECGDIQTNIRAATPSRKIPKPISADIETARQELQNNEKALKWLQGRGIAETSIQAFSIAFKEHCGKGWIGFPYFYHGKLVNIKWRTADKQILRETGADSTLYNIDNIDTTKPVTIVEGEIDCITAVQYGMTNTISVPNGAGAFSGEWLDDLEKCPEIFLCYDNDDAGNIGADRAAGMLGRHRCRRVRLPEKDLNDCLLSGMTLDDIEDFFQVAERYKDVDLLSYSEMIPLVREYIKNPRNEGLKTGWKEFDAHLLGIRPGEVTIVTGDSGVGKTTFMANMTYKLCQHGVTVISTETNPKAFIKKMYSMFLRFPTTRFIEDRYLEEAENYFIQRNTYLLNVHGECDYNRIRENLEFSVRRGVQIAVLDHLHFFLTLKDDNSERIEIQRFTKDVVMLAENTGMHIFLVCHPAKTNDYRTKKAPIIRANDLKGASSIKQDAANIISIWRDYDQEDSATIYILKVREDSGFRGKIEFDFDKRTQTYSEKKDGDYDDSNL